jgi:hypothetical protein
VLAALLLLQAQAPPPLPLPCGRRCRRAGCASCPSGSARGPPLLCPQIDAPMLQAALSSSGLLRAAGAPDLLIRTSGELRLSNFLLWELAYAELHFCTELWPDFGEAALVAALQDYAGRQRRFGGRPGS